MPMKKKVQMMKIRKNDTDGNDKDKDTDNDDGFSDISTGKMIQTVYS